MDIKCFSTKEKSWHPKLFVDRIEKCNADRRTGNIEREYEQRLQTKSSAIAAKDEM